MIFAYQLDGLKPDTLNPMTQNPTIYHTKRQTQAILLTHLAFATTECSPVRDELRNLVYAPETDAMSTAPSDIRLDEVDSLRSETKFQLSVEDTTAPRLVAAVSKDNSHVELEFSESIDLTTLASAAFSISDTGRIRNVHIVDFFPPL